MIKISNTAKFAALASVLVLAACTDKPKAVETAPPPASSMSSTTTSSIVPGSAEDLRVNVGDTVHFDYDAYNITDEGRRALAEWQFAWRDMREFVDDALKAGTIPGETPDGHAGAAA